MTAGRQANEPSSRRARDAHAPARASGRLSAAGVTGEAEQLGLPRVPGVPVHHRVAQLEPGTQRVVKPAQDAEILGNGPPPAAPGLDVVQLRPEHRAADASTVQRPLAPPLVAFQDLT